MYSRQIPLLAGGLGSLYAPNSFTFWVAAFVFALTATLQVTAAAEIFRLTGHRHSP